MLSDALIALLDARRRDQVGAYETALDRLGEAARHVDVVGPGHGAVAEGPEVAARVAADRAYIDALRRRRGSGRRASGAGCGVALGPPPVEPGAGPGLGAREAPGAGARSGDRYGYRCPLTSSSQGGRRPNIL